MGAFSVGIAPIFAIQRVKMDGLSAFGAFGLSSDPANFTDKGYSWSYGGGVRGGVQWNVSKTIRLGFSAQSEIWMTKFDKYSGLFADQGAFNIPANLTAGIAFDATPDLTLMVDYKHIFYSKIPSVGNSSSIPLQFGASGGPGFGWHDVDVVKVGAEWRATPAWTWRVGYAHNTNPIKSPDVTFNILAPGVVTDHITGGFAWDVTRNSTVEFAAAYVPTHSVSGPECLIFAAAAVCTPTAGSNIQLDMHQYQFTVGYTYKFDTAPVPAKLVRK
jgi:long-chain fatty acid transport protein